MDIVEIPVEIKRVWKNKLLERIKEEDTVFAMDVDRITRINKELEEIIEFAKNKRVKFVLGEYVIDGINGVDPVIEIMSNMLNEMREHEQSTINDMENI